MTIGDHMDVKDFYLENIVKASVYKSFRKLPKNREPVSRKRTYNSLEIEDDALKAEKGRGREREPEIETQTETVGEVSNDLQILESFSNNFITISDRTFTCEKELSLEEKDLNFLNNNEINKFENKNNNEIFYSLPVKDISLEFDQDNNNTLIVSNITKTRLKKAKLLTIITNEEDIAKLKTEIIFFKPVRIYQRSDYVKLTFPSMVLELKELKTIGKNLKFNAKLKINYKIELQEGILLKHPYDIIINIDNLLLLTKKDIPTNYEQVYSTETILKKKFDKVTPNMFYNLITDRILNFKQRLIIPELDTELFNFQNTTVNWLLSLEGVKYDSKTNSTSEQKFYEKNQNDDSKVCECLDRVAFGWSRIKMKNNENDILWYNRYTGNICSTIFAQNFLEKLPNQPAQGLLAEEMGLGKTVEILSLILLNKRAQKDEGTIIRDHFSERSILASKATLIICPESILKQWYQEINNLTSNLKITIYKGIYAYNKANNNDVNSKSYKTPAQIAKDLSKFDVVLATYQTVAREVHHALYNPSIRPKRHCAKTSRSRMKLANQELEDYSENPSSINTEDFENEEERYDYSSPLVLLQFWRIVLDEVQMVSNKISNAAKIAKVIPRFHSWGVSGTPIRKNLDDLQSFLSFSHLYPFDNQGSRLKSSNATWMKLIDDNSSLPLHFIRLFKNITLKHTKKMVSEDIKLPLQRRILLTLPFTPVEQNNYDHLFEEFLSTVCLNDKGEPVVEGWEPTTTILAYMREWLVRLRLACCHAQIGTGTIIKRSRNSDNDINLRTVDEVLDNMIADSATAVINNERKIVSFKLEKGQIYESYKKPLKSLEVWESCLPLTLKTVTDLREELARLERQEVELLDKKMGKEQQIIVEESTKVRARLRSWSELLHRIYFFIASGHYQAYNPQPEELLADEDSAEKTEQFKDRNDIPDEELNPEDLAHRLAEKEYYDKAELLRRQILVEPIKKVENLVNALRNKSENDKTSEVLKIDLGKNEFLGLESQFFYFKYSALCNELNQQAEKLNGWFQEVKEILTKSLSSTDDDDNNIANEYEDSILDQEKSYAYLDVIQKALNDRYEAVMSLKDQSAIGSLITKKSEDDESQIVLSKSAATKSDFHKELDKIRKEIRPDASNNPEKSLRTMVLKAKEIPETLLDNASYSQSEDRYKLEIAVFEKVSASLKKNLDAQKQNLTKLRKDFFNQLNDLYNARIEYYRSLQSLSDSVKEYERKAIYDYFPGLSEEEYRLKQVDQRIAIAEKLKTQTKNRVRYLESLKNTTFANTEDAISEEERFCIICRGPIVTGILTSCGHQYCKECLETWLQNKKNCPLCKNPLSKDSIYNFTYTRAGLKGNLITGEELNSDSKKIMHSIYKPMDEEVLKEIEDIHLYRSYGSKIDIIIKQVKWLKSKEPGVQIVVFSQWAELLHIIGAALKFNDIKFLGSNETLSAELGSGRRSRKFADVDIFKKNKSITCFLLNAKAQAAGLTLVNASHVFLCEPLVNTALELQAISRIHRIGQKKPTTIWMFAISNTVEESIVKLSTRRRLELLKENNSSDGDTNENSSETIGEDEVLDEGKIETFNTVELTKTLDGLVDKKIYGGEVVVNEDLWASFFS